jgi:EAL domain-containing protein (putative c-di-GMP-specific phosphodiesterase class I)
MGFSTLIELLKLAVTIIKLIAELVKAIRKRKKKPP